MLVGGLSMRRLLMTLFACLAVPAAVLPAGAQNLTITPDPASPVDERARVKLTVGGAVTAQTSRAFRLVIQSEEGAGIVFADPSPSQDDFITFPADRPVEFRWEAKPGGRYTIVVVGRFVNGAAVERRSGSLTGFVVRAVPNPYHLAVTPPGGAAAGTPITLRAQSPPGQSVPPGLRCLFEAIPATGPAATAMSPQCAPAEMRLAAGTWRLRLVVHRGTNPRAVPTLADTVGVSEITGYRVGGAADAPPAAPGASGVTVSCPSQCEARGGLCVKGREDVMPCLPGGRCPGGYACTGGYCKQTPATSGPVVMCGPRGGCPPGLRCQGGQCRAPAPAHQLPFACSSNADCAPPFVCAGRECRRACP
jgi:hypothetical protein